MPRGGRYRTTRVAMWGSPDFHKLTPNARLTYLALRTGSFSNLPGLFKVFMEPLSLETGLSAAELEAAIAELEKTPTPATSFVVRDHLGILWVRHQLAEDPARETDPEITNEWHRKGIVTIVGGLPKQSVVVRRFRRTFKQLFVQAPIRAPKGPHEDPQTEPLEVPESGIPEAGIPEPEAGSPEASGPQGPAPEEASKVALATGSNNGGSHDPDPPVQRWNEADEIKTFGRPLSLLERLGRQTLPDRLSETP